jgi:hypothetical protein
MFNWLRRVFMIHCQSVSLRSHQGGKCISARNPSHLVHISSLAALGFPFLIDPMMLPNVLPSALELDPFPSLSIHAHTRPVCLLLLKYSRRGIREPRRRGLVRGCMHLLSCECNLPVRRVSENPRKLNRASNAQQEVDPTRMESASCLVALGLCLLEVG